MKVWLNRSKNDIYFFSVYTCVFVCYGVCEGELVGEKGKGGLYNYILIK